MGFVDLSIHTRNTDPRQSGAWMIVMGAGLSAVFGIVFGNVAYGIIVDAAAEVILGSVRRSRTSRFTTGGAPPGNPALRR